jgi:hypothetical protein
MLFILQLFTNFIGVKLVNIVTLPDSDIKIKDIKFIILTYYIKSI